MKRIYLLVSLVLCATMFLSPEVFAQSTAEASSAEGGFWYAFYSNPANIILLLIILHMLYVVFFKKRKVFPEEFNPSGATTKNNEYVYNTCHDLYYNKFEEIEKDPDENGQTTTVNLPVGKSGMKQAHTILKDLIDNHLPVDGEANEMLTNVCIVYNQSGKWHYTGDKSTIIGFGIAAIIFSLIGGVSSAIYLGLSIVGFWLSLYEPSYQSVAGLVREKTGKKNGWDIVFNIIGGILTISGKIVAKSKALSWLGLIIAIIIYFFFINFLSIIVFLRYLRVFIFEK